MRIAQLMIGRGWGGVQTFFRDCCIEMSERGQPVLAIVRRDEWLHKTMSGFTNDYFQLEAVHNRFGSYDWQSIGLISRILHEYEPDIVIAHGQRSALFASRVKSQGRKHVWPLVSPVSARLKQKYFGGCDLLIPHTKSQADQSYHKDLVNPIFSKVIPIFRITEPVAEVKFRQSLKHLFSAGRLHVDKGFHYLIQAVHQLTLAGFDLQLTIAGDGPEMENLVKQRDSLGLHDRVRFLGMSEDVSILMKQSDVYVLPSVAETFGIVILEAMACGLPIVATDTDGPLEILNSSSAVLVEQNSASALCKGIEMAISMPVDTHQRTCEALKIYKERYTADIVVPQLLSLLKNYVHQRDWEHE